MLTLFAQRRLTRDQLSIQCYAMTQSNFNIPLGQTSRRFFILFKKGCGFFISWNGSNDKYEMEYGWKGCYVVTITLLPLQLLFLRSNHPLAIILDRYIASNVFVELNAYSAVFSYIVQKYDKDVNLVRWFLTLFLPKSTTNSKCLWRTVNLNNDLMCRWHHTDGREYYASKSLR